MYKELACISFLLGIGVFGTELVSRFKPSNEISSEQYKIQSATVLGVAALEIILSVYTIKHIPTITVIKMRLLALCMVAMLSATIVLRAKSAMFLMIGGSTYNLYNAASFFLCLVTITWATFLFYKKPIPVEDLPSIPLSDALRRRAQDYENQLDSGGAVTRSADDYYLQNGHEMLPSYYELPTPPPYTKARIPNTNVLQEAHTSRPVQYFVINTENTNDNRNNQTQSDISPNRHPAL